MILPECFIDTALAETLSFPKKGYKHIKGCYNVLIEMNKKPNNAILGIIDDDKLVPKALNSLRQIRTNLSTKHCKKNNMNDKIQKEDFSPDYNHFLQHILTKIQQSRYEILTVVLAKYTNELAMR